MIALTELASPGVHDGRALGGYETKFVIDAHAAHIANDWLARVYRPDGLHPANSVHGIYFDTRDWRYLNEKENSDFFKTKVRLRWYGSVDSFEPSGPARLEVKFKRGARRGKIRIPVALPAESIARLRLDDSALRMIPDSLRGAGISVPGRLLPAARIRYRRWRYFDPASGARLCLDSDITSLQANRVMLPRFRPARLPHAVVEIKADRREMPRLGTWLARLGCRKSSFSKYGSCMRHMGCEVD